MKSDISGKQGSSANKERLEEQKKMRSGIANPPQMTLDPERRRDFFNRLLEKYSTKSTKINNPSTGVGFGPRSARFPSVPPTKTPIKLKDKFLKKKKSSSDRSIVKSATIEDYNGLDAMDSWKNSVKNHQYDTSVYKNHVRIRARFPYPLPIIEELIEPSNTSEVSDSDETKSGDTTYFESISHSFTLLPCCNQKPGCNENVEVKYEEKIVKGDFPLPEELQARHLSKTSSGTLVWVGNDVIHNLVKKKKNKKYVVEDFTEKESKSIRDLRTADDVKSSGEGEDRPPSKKSGKIRRSKIKKNSSALELEDSTKVGVPSSQESKTNVKPSSSSLTHLGQDDGKSSKKLNDKVKKPKKLTKKQTFTLVTSKPPV